MYRIILTLLLALMFLACIGWTPALFSEPPVQTIKICKEPAPGGASFAFLFQWSNAGGSQPSFSLKAGECVTKTTNPAQGPNIFKESPAVGWTLTHISCSGDPASIHITGADNAPGFQKGDDTVTIDSQLTNVVCTFTNTAQSQGCCNFDRDLSTGQNNLPRDPFWSLKPNPAYLVTKPGIGWIDLPPAKWLQPNPGSDPDAAPGQYDYVITFDVPVCTGGVSLKGKFAADNSGKAFLDGKLIPGSVCDVVPPNKRAFCFTKSYAPVPLNLSYIAPGTHTLKIEVGNESIAGWNASGLLVNAHLFNVCMQKKTNMPRN